MGEPRYEYLRIGLPLPLTVIGPLGDLIDKAWPGAAVITDPEKAGAPPQFWNAWRRSEEMLVRIDVSKAAKRVTKKAAREHAEAYDDPDRDDDGLTFGGFKEDGTAQMSAPERLTEFLAPLVEAVLADEQIINYLSWRIVGRPDGPLAGKAAFVSVARSEGQTPHEMHMAEKARADQLAVELAELKASMADAQPHGE